MAYNKEKIFEQAKKEAEDTDTFFIEDVVSLVACSKATFYTFFPNNSEELDAIKEILGTNKVKKKREIRKLLAAGKGVELISLYKLLATDEERKALSMTHVDHTTKGNEIKSSPAIDYSKLSTAALKEIQAASKPNEDEKR